MVLFTKTFIQPEDISLWNVEVTAEFQLASNGSTIGKIIAITLDKHYIRNEEHVTLLLSHNGNNVYTIPHYEKICKSGKFKWNVASENTLVTSILDILNPNGTSNGSLATDTPLYAKYDKATHTITLPDSIPYSEGFTMVPTTKLAGVQFIDIGLDTI